MRMLAWMITAMVLAGAQASAQSGAVGANQNPDPDQDQVQGMGGALTQSGGGADLAGNGGTGGDGGSGGSGGDNGGSGGDNGGNGQGGQPGQNRPMNPSADRPVANFPETLVQQLTQVRQGRETMLAELKGVLEQNREATQEERRNAVEAWKQANSDLIEQQRQLAQSVKAQIREYLRLHSPEDAGDAEPPVDEEGNLDMAQVRERTQGRIQTQQELRQKIQNASDPEARRQLEAEYLIMRRQQVQERRMEILAREGTLNRQASIEALRQLLQTNAESLRARARLQQRDEVVEQIQTQTRQTIRERNTVQQREDAIERPDQPDRPERPERPETGSTSRRERLEERVNP